jgi:hypothetical protein
MSARDVLRGSALLLVVGAVAGCVENRVDRSGNALAQATTGEDTPVLLIGDAGGHDLLSEERVANTPYAAFVAFLHALRAGDTDAARRYASEPRVLEEARVIPRHSVLRAEPGVRATDAKQGYRLVPSANAVGMTVDLKDGTMQPAQVIGINVQMTRVRGRWLVHSILPNLIVTSGSKSPSDSPMAERRRER